MAGSHLLSDSVAYGNIWRWQGLLQQLLWTWSVVLADRQYGGTFAQEGSTTVAVEQMVPQRVSRVLHVLLYPDDLAYSTSGKWSGIIARNHTLALDIQRALALVLPYSH